MKKYWASTWLIFVMLFFVVTTIRAATITEEMARTAALSFISKDAIGSSILKNVSISVVEKRGNLWLVKLAPSGYILLAGTDLAAPVIAFSQNNFVEPSEDSAFYAVMKGAGEGCATLEAEEKTGGSVKKRSSLQNNVDDSSLIEKRKAKWQELLSTQQVERISLFAETRGNLNLTTGEVNISPFLKTKWNQWQPYNDFAPVHNPLNQYDYYRGRTASGCAATAASQVLAYWSWPNRLDDAFAFDHIFSDNHSNDVGKVLFGIRFDGHTSFDWTALNDTYALNGNDWRHSIAESMRYPIARLLLFCDSLSWMHFSIKSGSAGHFYSIANMALPWYEPGRRLSKDDGHDELVSAIRADIQNKVPVLICIPGHAVIGHGWKEEASSRYVYLNYGYSGSNDGYYNVDDISSSTSLQDACIGFVPRKSVSLNPLSSVSAESLSLSWNLPQCYANDIDGFRVEVEKESDDVFDFCEDFEDEDSSAYLGMGNSCVTNGRLRLGSLISSTFAFRESYALTSGSVLSFKVDSAWALNMNVEVQASFDGGDWITLVRPCVNERTYSKGERKYSAFIGDRGGSLARFRIVSRTQGAYYPNNSYVDIDDFTITDVKKYDVVKSLSANRNDRLLSVNGLQRGARYKFSIIPLMDGGILSEPVYTRIEGEYMELLAGEKKYEKVDELAFDMDSKYQWWAVNGEVEDETTIIPTDYWRTGFSCALPAPVDKTSILAFDWSVNAYYEEGSAYDVITASFEEYDGQSTVFWTITNTIARGKTSVEIPLSDLAGKVGFLKVSYEHIGSQYASQGYGGKFYNPKLKNVNTLKIPEVISQQQECQVLPSPEILSVENVKEGFFRECSMGVSVIKVKCSASTDRLEAFPSHYSLIRNEDVVVAKNGGGDFTVAIKASNIPATMERSRMILTLKASNKNNTSVYKDLVLRFSTETSPEAYDFNKCVVFLDANGGTLQESASCKVQLGSCVGELPIPTFQGYKFIGWFSSHKGGYQISSNTIVEENVIFYAHWEAVTASLDVFETSIRADSTGCSGTVAIAANCGWTVSASKSWIIASPLSGNGNDTISYTILENDLDSSRSGEIVVSSLGGIRRVISVFQEAKIEKQGNDNFANATLLSGESGELSASNAGATFETGEPQHKHSSATTSVWWKWTPTKSGSVTFSTEGSSFDTILAVYTGSTLSSLEQYALDDDKGSNQTSICTFEVVAGTTYYIAVAGYDAKTGAIKLSWEQIVKVLPDLIFSYHYLDEWTTEVFLSNLVTGKEPVTTFDYGEKIYLFCGFGNDGEHILEDDFNIRHELIDGNGCVISTWNYTETDTIPIGKMRKWEGAEWGAFDNLSPGTYTYRCTLDERNDIEEINEFDNVREYEFTVQAPPPVFTIENGVLTGVELNGATEVVIPSKINGISVKTIGAAFEDCVSLEKVVMSEGVLSIGRYAFYGCTSLKCVVIPNSVTSIGSEAFCRCTSLGSVSIPNGVTYIGARAFSQCDSLSSVVIPDSVTEIENETFRGCGLLGDVTIGNGVTNIEDYAFYYCGSITNIHFGGKIERIGLSAFDHAMETSYGYEGDICVHISNLTNWCNINFISETSNPLYEGAKLYVNNELVSDLVIPKGAKQIGDYAFCGCVSLTSVSIPDTINSIWGAFRDCCNLTYAWVPISLREQVENNYVFLDCSDGLQIEYYSSSHIVAFNANGGVVSQEAMTVEYGEKIGTLPTPTRDGYTFLGWFTAAEGGEQVTADTVVTGDMTLYAHWEEELKEPSFEIDENGVLSSLELNGATEIIIPSNVKVIADEALSGCCDLTSVTIPEGVVSIGYDAFNCCCALTSINIPSTVTNIGENAFGNCTNLRIVTGGEGLKRVGYDAFYETLFLYGEDSWEDIEVNEDYANGYGLDLVQLGNFIVGRRGSLAEAENDEYYDEEGNWIWEYNLIISEGTTGIADGLFADLPITSVTIPGSIKRIPENVFQNCSYLKNLTINEGVEEIGEYAFSYAGCNLEEDVITALTIPSSVVKIGEYAFADFGYLKYVIGLDDTDDISGDAFIWTPYVEGWYSPSLMIEDGVVYGLLEELRFDDGCITNGTLYIPEGVTNIASSAFNGCSEFCNVNLPDTLQLIGDYAFSSSSLTNVIIPASVQRVGYWAFDGCGESLYDKASIPGVILVDGWAVCYTESLSGWLNLSGVSGIGKGAFNGCDSLTGVTIPDGVTCIDSDAFSCCSSLMGVAIPDSVTSIEGYAFHGCSSLAGVTIPSGVTKIGYQAFGGCERLERIRIPDGVKYVGVDAFANCMSLHTVTVPQLLCGWYSGSDEFSGDFEYNNLNAVMYCGSLTNLVIATGVTNIADGVFSGLCSLMGVTIPSSVTDIGRDVFNCCCSLENIIIPNGVTNIGPYAFGNCYSLRRVTIPDSVTYIGSMAFYSCYNLESLRIPDGITYIGHDAFGGCTALKSVTVPQLLCGWYSSSDDWEGDFQYSNLSSVMYCGSLTNLVIATGVTNIADNVFSSCDSLIGVTIPNSVVSIGAGAFAYCGFESVSIPDGVLSISADAFYGCSRLVDVTIPDSVKSVCASAFWGCNDLLYDVTILPGVQLVDGWAVGYDSLLPECLSLNGVRGVASEAFGYCDSLVGVTIPDGVKSVCASAFYGCSSLENVVFSGDISYVGACAFWECGLLGKVTVPQLLCGIYSNDGFNDGDGSFTYNHLSDVIDCGSLTNLVLASGVTNIEERVFSYCGSLQEIAISDSVVNIGNYVFEGCYSLNSIYIPESVENIGKYAFANCYNLMYAKIPLVLKNQIEEGNVFDGCPEDMRIDYYEILPLLAPVITPCDGTEFYEDSCTVTITCETEGALIYYTTDGTTPRPRPANLYSGPFGIADTTTVKAIAVKGEERTDLVSATIVKKEIVLAAPVITPTDGTEFYEDSCTVTISCATEGASIYYVVCDTNNVTNPRPSDRNLYTGPFTVSATKTVRAFSMFGSKTSDIVSSTLIKRELTLPVAVDAPELTFTTGGDAKWTPEFNGSANVGGSLAQSGVLSWSETDDDPSETWMETTVAGAGTFSFWWKVDCEDDPWGATWDRFEVYTNGVEAARIDGKTEWEKIEFTFADSRAHTVRWRFCKDDWDDEKLTDLAWVDGVDWTPASTDVTVDVGGGKNVVVPVSWIDKYDNIVTAAGGDKVAALMFTAANGRKVWECFMLGIDPTKADDDFKITRFWMENGKPMFEFSHSVDGAGNSFAPRIKTKGKAKLSDSWSDVPTGGDSSFRFFTVEVMLP